MKLITLFLALTCSASVFADSSSGEWRQSLDGEWNFTTTFDPAPGDWFKITVPGNWDTTKEHKNHQGTGWYRREFTPGKDLAGKQLRLRFEAVYHESEVFLNGERLGKHIGGYTPFEFDVTDKVNFDKANTLTVRADNTYQRGAWWPWGGISRPVKLIANNPLRIVHQHIHAKPDLEAGTATITINYHLENKGKADAQVILQPFLANDEEARLEKKEEVEGQGSKEIEVSFELAANEVRLWHFDYPELYQLRTELRSGEKVQHALVDRFGIRKIEVTPTSLLLNGESVRLVGFNRVSDDHGEAGNTEPLELLRKDIDLMKRCGTNMTRIMHYPQSPDLLDLCDEKGILLVCEIPVWQHDSQIITDNPITKHWLTEMIHRDYNHPCIIGWSVGNEMRDHNAYTSSMMKFVREELDPHRLVTYVSDLCSRDAGVDEPIDETDIVMINYYRTWAEYTEIVAERWPEKPIFASEFGLRQLEPSGQFAKGFLEAWEELTTDNPRFVGASLWTFNDYRSNFKGTPETGFRSWGIVDEHRKIKPAFYTIRKLFSPIQNLKRSGLQVTFETRGHNQTPSYPLRGYKLRWVKGDLSGELPLPDLMPGNTPWSGQLPDEAAGEDVYIQLITPLGYDIDDTIVR